MCGILGLIGNVDVQHFDNCLNVLEHRGPDAYGSVHNGIHHLGHRRLSIIDVSDAANQPMFSNDGRYCVIYNGEIYNFQEIKIKLQKNGYIFSTDSDTEVLLNAYIEWGPSFLKKLNGMFAFSITDFEKNKTFIARDRLGIKPLYYFKNKNHFYYSSEPKGIIKLSKLKFKLNLESVCSYLCFRYPVNNASFFEGIVPLKKGTWMLLEGSNIIETGQYWDLKDVLKMPKIDDEKSAISTVHDILKSSIEYRMISDVPVGAYLSGGVDSSAVTAIMASISKSPIHTFTIGFNNDGYNEFEYSRIIAKRYETIHKEILLSADEYLSSISELIKIKDAPLGVPNEVPLYLMSKILKKDITVVLSGEGADEIFGGYGRIFRSADDGQILDEWSKNDYETNSILGKRLFEIYGNNRFENEVERFLHLYRYNDKITLSKLVNSEILSDFNNGPTMDIFKKTFNESSEYDFGTQMMYVFELLHLPGLLQRVDSTTMGASVEARVPFVDHRLVEFAFQLSKNLKMRWKNNPVKDKPGKDSSEVDDITKWVLKEAVHEYIGSEIVERKKIGFPVPLDQWNKSEIFNEIKSTILNGKMIEKEIINKDALDDILDDTNQNNNNAMLIWMLFNLEIFIKLNNSLLFD